jgi:hypothetical protein
MECQEDSRRINDKALAFDRLYILYYIYIYKTVQKILWRFTLQSLRCTSLLVKLSGVGNQSEWNMRLTYKSQKTRVSFGVKREVRKFTRVIPVQNIRDQRFLCFRLVSQQRPNPYVPAKAILPFPLTQLYTP